jgi:hypothetical protein
MQACRQTNRPILQGVSDWKRKKGRECRKRESKEKRKEEKRVKKNIKRKR